YHHQSVITSLSLHDSLPISLLRLWWHRLPPQWHPALEHLGALRRPRDHGWDRCQHGGGVAERDTGLPDQHRQPEHGWRGDHPDRSEEHTSELQSLAYLVCRL